MRASFLRFSVLAFPRGRQYDSFHRFAPLPSKRESRKRGTCAPSFLIPTSQEERGQGPRDCVCTNRTIFTTRLSPISFGVNATPLKLLLKFLGCPEGLLSRSPFGVPLAPTHKYANTAPMLSISGLPADSRRSRDWWPPVNSTQSAPTASATSASCSVSPTNSGTASG